MLSAYDLLLDSDKRAIDSIDVTERKVIAIRDNLKLFPNYDNYLIQSIIDKFKVKKLIDFRTLPFRDMYEYEKHLTSDCEMAIIECSFGLLEIDSYMDEIEECTKNYKVLVLLDARYGDIGTTLVLPYNYSYNVLNLEYIKNLCNYYNVTFDIEEVSWLRGFDTTANSLLDIIKTLNNGGILNKETIENYVLFKNYTDVTTEEMFEFQLR